MDCSVQVDRPHPRVQDFCAEPANVRVQRRQIAVESTSHPMLRPLQHGCYACSLDIYSIFVHSRSMFSKLLRAPS
jgi:hypothetical protein